MSDYIWYLDEATVQLGDDAIEKGDFDLGLKLYYIAYDRVYRYQGDKMAPIFWANSLKEKINKIKSTLSEEITSLNPTNWDLSKSSFIKGKQCHKYLYLDRYKKGERTPPDEKTKEKFKKGHLFEDHFRKTKFSSGINIKEKLGMNFRYFNSYTDYLLQKESKITLFEGTLVENDILVMVDVINKQNNNMYDFYEIKLHKELSDVIWNDLAIQYYVCEKRFGKQINTFNAVLRQGEDEWQIIDLKNKLEEYLNGIDQDIIEYKSVLNKKIEPNISAGDQCEHPYTCEFIHYCNSLNDVGV